MSSTAWEGAWRKCTNRWWLRPAIVPDGLPPRTHSLENPSKRGSRVQIGKALKGEGLKKKNKKQRLLQPLPKYCQVCWGREQRASLLLIDFPTARVLAVRTLLHPSKPFFCRCSSVAQSCLTLCDPVDCGTPDLPVLHCLLGFAPIHVH